MGKLNAFFLAALFVCLLTGETALGQEDQTEPAATSDSAAASPDATGKKLLGWRLSAMAGLLALYDYDRDYSVSLRDGLRTRVTTGLGASWALF